jgi:hypothetical protein
MDGANNPGLHAHNQLALKRAFCVWLGDFPESNLPFDKFVWNEFGDEAQRRHGRVVDLSR